MKTMMGWLTGWIPRKKASVPVVATTVPAYAFCENVAAGSASPWHIRLLTEKGKKVSGGADTPALCGHVVHWDRQYPISRSAVFVLGLGESICSKCSTLYMESTGL